MCVGSSDVPTVGFEAALTSPCPVPAPLSCHLSCAPAASQPAQDISAQHGHGQLSTEVLPFSGLGLQLSGEFLWTGRKKSGFLC